MFDIVAQPLTSALSRYGDITGREVLYDAGLAKGRLSAPTQGVLTPETALSRLLDGTGLSATFMSDGSFVLTSRSENQQPLVQSVSGTAQDFYYGRIQASFRRAVCASIGGRAVHYRVAALFWIASSGRVARYERLGAADSSDLDRAVDQALRDMQIGAPPPEGFRQPVLAMVAPKTGAERAGCDRPQDGQRAAEARP